MDINGKIWGTTSRLFSKNNVEIYRITGNKSGKSSNHKHCSKLSMFYVERGSLAVVIEKNDYQLIDKTVLVANQSIIIKPGEYHYFEVLEDDTLAFEIYWVEIDPDDIQRKDVGSITKEG